MQVARCDIGEGAMLSAAYCELEGFRLTLFAFFLLTDPRPMDFGKDPVFNHKPSIDGGELSPTVLLLSA